MKKLTVNQMEITKGGKFWGYEITDCGACMPAGYKVCHRKHYIFWIAFDASDDYVGCQYQW